MEDAPIQKTLSNEDASDYGGQSNLNSFFYTFERSIDKMTDNEIFSELVKKYRLLDNSFGNDSEVRKTILEMLNNESFMVHFLKKFDITIMELFEVLCRKHGTAFANALFIKKVKNAISGKSYFKQPE